LCRCLSSKVILVDLVNLELISSIIKNLRSTLNVTRIILVLSRLIKRNLQVLSIIRNQLRAINYAQLIAQL